MKEQDFLDGISNIDPEIVGQFVSMDMELKAKRSNKPKRRKWFEIGAMVACIALVVGAASYIPRLFKDTPQVYYSEAESSYSEPESSYQEPESSYPEPESIYPEPESSYPEPESSYPEPESSYPEHESSYPEPESSYPEPESSYPDPESSYPEPESSYTEPESSYPEPESSYPEPESSYPEPESSYPEPESSYPEPESSYPEPDSSYAEPESNEPESSYPQWEWSESPESNEPESSYPQWEGSDEPESSEPGYEGSGEPESNEPGYEGSEEPEIPSIPEWVDTEYSAGEVASVFDDGGIYESTNTNSYTTLYAPNDDFLYIHPMPNDEYINIYNRLNTPNTGTEADVRKFIDGILPTFAYHINASVPSEYTVTKRDELNEYYTAQKIGAGVFRGKLNKKYFEFTYDQKGLYIGGNLCIINPTLSDEKILASVNSAKEALFDIFGVSFTDAKVVWFFESYLSAPSLCIYFYNEGDHPLNSIQKTPVTDYIQISFHEVPTEMYQYPNFDVIQASKDLKTTIIYKKSRIVYSKVGTTVKKISLEDAEALLYNGCVFGGHTCTLCTKEQDRISFEGYDYVGLEYIPWYYLYCPTPKEALPFYVFYKKIGMSKNGNVEYAKTYVAAFQVSGYEQYLEDQKIYH